MARSLLTIFFLLGFSSAAFAQWITKVEDDILTDGKSATMIGLISTMQAVHVTCNSGGSLTIAFIERSEHVAGMEIIPFRMVVQADKGEKYWLDVENYRHNAEYTGFRSDKSAIDVVLLILRDIGRGKSKLGIGLKAEVGDFSWSGNLSLRGSTNAVSQLTKACDLSLSD